MILDLTYGYIIKEEGKDPLVDLADKVSEFTSHTCLMFNGHFTGTWPILRSHGYWCIPY